MRRALRDNVIRNHDVGSGNFTFQVLGILLESSPYKRTNSQFFYQYFIDILTPFVVEFNPYSNLLTNLQF